VFTMFLVTVCLIIAAIILWIKEVKDGKDIIPIRIFALIPLLIACVLFFWSAWTPITAGHVGVISTFGAVNTTEVLSEGANFVMPYRSVYEQTIQTINYTTDADVLSKDGLGIKIDVSIPYRLNGETAAWVYQNFGTDWQEDIITPSIRSAIRDAAALFTSEDVYSRRRDSLQVVMSKFATKEVTKYFERYSRSNGIEIGDLMLRNIILPKQIIDAIERKLESDQAQQQMDFVIQKETKEAERKRIEAGGIKDFQEIVSQGISDKLLEWKGIEATVKLAESPNTKVVVIGSSKDGLPLILGGGN
jgi:prohibitin 1